MQKDQKLSDKCLERAYTIYETRGKVRTAFAKWGAH